MENKFKEGQTVYALENPGQAIIVRRYVDRIYFCRPGKDSEAPDLIYFERELTDKK